METGFNFFRRITRGSDPTRPGHSSPSPVARNKEEKRVLLQTLPAPLHAIDPPTQAAPRGPARGGGRPSEKQPHSDLEEPCRRNGIVKDEILEDASRAEPPPSRGKRGRPRKQVLSPFLAEKKDDKRRRLSGQKDAGELGEWKRSDPEARESEAEGGEAAALRPEPDGGACAAETDAQEGRPSGAEGQTEKEAAAGGAPPVPVVVKRGRGRPRKERKDEAASANVLIGPKRGRGRPRKQRQDDEPSKNVFIGPKRGRGRPRKIRPEGDEKQEEKVKRGRGRPRKYPRPENAVPANPPAPGEKRKRGRPRKTPFPSAAPATESPQQAPVAE
ncbi:AT hook motif domain-containing protein [Besnoitia besnoiti]|uniref:AT hook motif domain-containing protein n=1 Tax=Besnoitia besnoiti TaxID=94643 RepID=A0A2A9M034_BESBE|nr:AT hook motif domain-containing protein [Besnoitia besnoiti]PFH31319.1 AT hook motif domain-containing protein [Besnoitia besnoiti]